MEIKQIKTLQNVAQDIEQIVTTKKCGYIEAITIYCEHHKIEIETVAPLIKKNSTIKARLQLEGESLNLLPKSRKLPI